MTVNLTEEQIAKILSERKAMQAQRAAEDQVLGAEKAQAQAVWAAKQAASFKPVTVRKAHRCAACEKTIQVGEKTYTKSMYGNIATGCGYTGGFRTDHYCTSCHPAKEV